MNVLYVSQYFPPEIGAPAVRVYEMTSRWRAAGVGGSDDLRQHPVLGAAGTKQRPYNRTLDPLRPKHDGGAEAVVDLLNAAANSS